MDGKPHHVEVIPADAADPHRRFSLNGVSACLVIRLRGIQICREQLFGDLVEFDLRDLVRADRAVGEEQGDTADDGVPSPRQCAEHPGGVGSVAGLAENFPVGRRDDRVRRKDQRVGRERSLGHQTKADLLRFAAGKQCGQLAGVCFGAVFVRVRAHDRKGDAEGRENLPPARGRGCQNDFHDILHSAALRQYKCILEFCHGKIRA